MLAAAALALWSSWSFASEPLGPLRPAYRLVEGVSDGVFDLLRVHLLGPARGELRGYQESDSLAAFERLFTERQRSHLLRSRSAPSLSAAAFGREELLIAAGSLRDALLERYRVRALGRWAGRQVRDPENWEPATLAAAGVVGSAAIYFAGLRAGWGLGPVRLGLDIEPVLRQGLDGRAGGVELRLTDFPIRLRSDLAWDDRRLRQDTVSLQYETRF